MEFITTPIEGLIVVQPRRFEDARGYFMETYRKSEFEAVVGEEINFVQDNESESARGVLRGLHMQTGADSQAKLVRVVSGEVFDVAVDMRPGSATLGRWYGTVLSHRNAKMLFIPRGFAHGFFVLSDLARFVYKTDNYYAPASEVTLRFDDPDIAVGWPAETAGNVILSPRDIEKAIPFRTFLELNRDLYGTKVDG